MNLKKILAIILATVTCIAILASCTSTTPEEESSSESSSESSTGGSSNTEKVERFDYFGADMSEYISIGASDYKNTTATISKMFDGSDEGVMAYIDMLRKEYSVATDNKIVDRPIKEGDTVMLYYEGYKDGVAFSGGSNMSDENAYALTIGSGAFIPGFEEALIGIIPAETSRENLVDLNLTFPEDYKSAELAGQAVVFKVYVEYIVEYAPAEYTEEFITKTLQYSTTDTDVKASFEKYVKEQIIPSVRDTEILNILWNELFEKAVVISYPQSEIDYYYNSYIEQYNYYMEYYTYFGYSFSSLDDFVEQYLGLEKGADWKAMTREQCEVDVMQNLLFHAIAQQEGLTITQTDYQNSINYYIDYYKNNGYTYTAAQVEESVGSRFLKEHALFEKVQALLIENCTVIYSDDVDGGNEKVEESTSESESVESESVESSAETEIETIE